MEILLFIAAMLVAYANGANDNFKGVATLFGSRTLNFRWSLGLATTATLAGSLLALVLAGRLALTFSGKGLVPDTLVGSPEFMTAVGLGAGGAVLAASLIGLPISTTHALTGGLLGAGFAAAGSALRWQALGGIFLLPLLASPLLAAASTWLLYPLLRALRLRLGIEKESCVCVRSSPNLAPVMTMRTALSVSTGTGLEVQVDSEAVCRHPYAGTLIGVGVQRLADALHITSAALVSFARGLNDTPKIVALLLVAHGMRAEWGLSAVALGIALGGLLGARKVAKTMSHQICSLNPGRGVLANTVTALFVLGASRFGVPVSTTHVSVGSLFGIGASTGTSTRTVTGQILLAWVATLPFAALLSLAAYTLLK